MPIFAHIFIGILSFIIRIMPGMLVSLLKMLGVGIITYQGLDYVSGEVWSFILNEYNGLPTDVIQILDLGGVHSALMMIISTATAIFAFQITHKIKQKMILKKKSTLIA